MDHLGEEVRAEAGGAEPLASSLQRTRTVPMLWCRHIKGKEMGADEKGEEGTQLRGVLPDVWSRTQGI